MRAVIRDRLAIIMVAIRRLGIAIVKARLDQVHLIAALGAHFLFPQPPVLVERDAQQVAMAIGPGRRMKAFGRQRIARCGRAVQVQAQHLAQCRLGVLRRVELLALAIGEEQVSAVG